jgi:hypothetical protein
MIALATQEKSALLFNYVCAVLAGAVNWIAGFNRGLNMNKRHNASVNTGPGGRILGCGLEYRIFS